VRLNLYTNMDQSDRAVGVGLDYLRQVDRRWSLHATAEDVRQDYDELWKRLGSRSIEALLDLPFMTDPDRCATMDVLTALASPALFTDEHLFRLVVGRMASLSLEHGNSDGSSLAYAWLGGVLGTYFGDYQAGFRFGRLGLDLVEKRGLDRFSARVYLVFAVHVAPWTQPLRTSCAFLRRAFKAAEEAGDLSYAAYSCIDLITNRFATGDPLDEVEREAESGFEFARKVWFGLASDCITGQLRLIRMLRGLTRDFTSFNDAEFDEGRFEQRLENNRQLAIGACWYWIRKLQARVYASDWASAVVAASKVAPLLWTAPTQFELAEYHFYGALARAAHCNMISAEERVQQLEALAAHHQQLALWAKTCPETFANRAALVGAEIARLEGRELDAERLYEEAIRLARKHSFIQNEGLGNELAARFYAARSFEKIAHAYLRDARYCYLHWGADGKVRQLNQLYPQLREEEPLPGPMSTIVAPVEHLDLATVIKVSQTVSGEIVLSKLIETLMRIAIEHAGAERGLLILFRSDKPRVEAEATTRIGRIEVTLRQAEVTVAELPESVLHYVMRTRESVILDDAAALTLFSADAYVQQRRPRSVLCLPLVKQAKLVGALYLENNLTPRAFTSDRIAVLELLASQAAISLENAELYADLQQENADRKRVEEELRRSESFLAEGQRISHTGSWGWNLSTGKLVWSEEHCRIFGFDPKKTEPTLQSFWERVHPEDRSLVEQTLDGAIRERSGFALEFRIALPDGSNKHLHGVGRPVLKAAGDIDEYIGTTMDITERKRGEEALRNAQADLTRVARLTTMGELAASIAHEISQPLGAMVANGDACLLWLANDRPNLDEARQAVKRIVGEGQRAGDIIRSVRALAGKSGPEMTQFDINDAIREVLILMRSELRRHDVSLETELSGGLEPIMGDRVQLQQVILNLIMNGIEAMSMVMHRPRVLRVRSQIDWPSIVLIAIEDSGPGFAPETMDHLFEAFFTTKLSGMGMGLSICRSIIDAHGGRLWASPRSPQGAVFQFTVPTVVKAGA
jgi:PAS domain S-box-containing protein